MKRKRFTEEQIIRILKESEAGAKKQKICRSHGISEHTFYRWRSKYGVPCFFDLHGFTGLLSSTALPR